MGWPTKQQPHPAPQPYIKPRICSALCCSQQFPDKPGLSRPSQKPRQWLESVFQPLTAGHSTEWHKTGSFLAKKGSSKQKWFQQAHMAVIGQVECPASNSSWALHGAVEALMQTAKSCCGHCKQHSRGKSAVRAHPV